MLVVRAPRWPWRSRSLAPELLDQPGQPTDLVAGSLDDLRRINRWLGGNRLTLAGLDRLVGGLPAGATLTVLDVATGGADIPRAIARWGRRRGFAVRLVAVDRNPTIARRAVGASQDRPWLAVADGRRLPFADRSVDIATCSLFLHHLTADEAVLMLSELRRVARRGLVVNDLVRGGVGYVGAWAISRLFTRNQLTRHDAPLSARRAFTRAEMADLAARAGLGPVTFSGAFGYRVSMTAEATP